MTSVSWISRISRSSYRDLASVQGGLVDLVSFPTLAQYREDLEICFAAIGDARCDRWPLQVTTFASGFDLEQLLGSLFGEIIARLPLAREPDWEVATEWKHHEFWWSADGGSSSSTRSTYFQPFATTVMSNVPSVAIPTPIET